MKKRFALMLALCMLFPLCACSRKAAPAAPTPAPAPTETAAPTPAPTPTPEPTATPEPLPLIPDLPPVHDEALNAILDQVLTVYPGSAGSSLRAAACAARLLDWGMETELTDDEIYSAVGCWLDEQDDENLKIFLESIWPVYDRCYDLKGEYAKDLMRDAGIEDSLYPWNERAFRAVEMVCYGCGLR